MPPVAPHLARPISLPRAALALTGLTVRAAAEIIGVHEESLGRVLSGRRLPSPRLKADFAALVGIPEERLWPQDSP